MIVVETSEAHNVAELIARSWNQNWRLLHNWNRDWDELALRLGIPWRSGCGLDSIPRKKTTFGFCHTGREPCRHGWRLNLQNVRGLSGERTPGICLFTWTFPLSRILSQHIFSESHTRNIHFQVLTQCITTEQRHSFSIRWITITGLSQFIMVAPQPVPYIIAIHNSKSPVKNSNGNLVWSVEVVFDGKIRHRQFHDPVRIIYSS